VNRSERGSVDAGAGTTVRDRRSAGAGGGSGGGSSAGSGDGAVADAATRLRSERRERSGDRPAPRLLGLGTALPARARPQSEVCEQIAAMLGLRGAERTRWERIWRGTSIERRHAVISLGEVLPLSTAARMELFDAHATKLAATAARRALDDAGMSASQVTDLVVVTCTGFSAPGVPRRLVSALALDAGVRTSQIGFMGCFGGVCGLRAAAAHAGAERGAVSLVVCVELCSLHLRNDRDPQNLVASALFADGAAAAVVGEGGADRDAVDHEPRAGEGAVRGSIDSGSLAVLPGRSRTIEGTLDAMSWTVTDRGFEMTLSRDVPGSLAASLAELSLAQSTVLLHPGGPAVIDAVEAAIPTGSRGAIGDSRGVLRECGNMSSATVLFVLERWRRRGGRGDASLVAFGPGLTIDLVELRASTRS